MAGDPVRPITHEERGRFLLEYIELLLQSGDRLTLLAHHPAERLPDLFDLSLESAGDRLRVALQVRL